jgi:hypothetical protein
MCKDFYSLKYTIYYRGSVDKNLEQCRQNRDELMEYACSHYRHYHFEPDANQLISYLAKKNVQAAAAACGTSICASSLPLHTPQTSSKPLRISSQARAHSLFPSRPSHPPFSIHIILSSLPSISTRHSLIASLTVFNRLPAVVVVCRFTCKVSER